MQIQLQQINKRFNNQWILRDVNYTFESSKKYAILGINGSGKSTLLQIIAGYVVPSSGKINYSIKDNKIESDQFYKYIGFASPAMELIEEFTIEEFFTFHFQQKKQILSVAETIAYIGLQQHANKKIEHCSSGMKQRIKLAQAIIVDVPILFLDEPCSNFDTNGFDLYYKMIADFASNKLVIVSSNVEQEYTFCSHQINLNQLKNQHAQR